MICSTHSTQQYTKTDERGSFCINDRSYQGQLLDAYVCLRAVPGPNNKSLPLEKPICLFLGTYAPIQARIGWHFKMHIPQTIWCRLNDLSKNLSLVTPDAFMLASRRSNNSALF